AGGAAGQPRGVGDVTLRFRSLHSGTGRTYTIVAERDIKQPTLAQFRVCLVHFAKRCKDVKMAFKVLNEVYLQNFLHRWVVNRETNLMMLINPCLINN